jgi:uncharacterized protein (DUF2141 family)
MKKLILVGLSILLIGRAMAQTISEANGKIMVVVNNCRNNNGTVCFALFNRPDGFPGAKKAFKIVYEKITHNSSTAEFDNLPDGEYAVSIFHDENNNKIMDKSLIGMPTEGHGASNDAKGHFGPPAYSDAKFDLKNGAKSIKISLYY